MIQNSMKSNMEWINRTIAANGLEKAGPMRIISTELGRENYTFDVVQPVRKAGTGDDEEENQAGAEQENGDEGQADDNQTEENQDENGGEEAAGQDQAAGDDAAPVRVPTMPPAPVRAAAGEPLEGLKLQGPVKYVRQPARSAATATYVGFMAELENVRNALRAWALTQGYEPTGRPYEVYKNGIDNAFTADENNQAQGQFDVYWDLKSGRPASSARRVHDAARFVWSTAKDACRRANAPAPPVNACSPHAARCWPAARWRWLRTPRTAPKAWRRHGCRPRRRSRSVTDSHWRRWRRARRRGSRGSRWSLCSRAHCCSPAAWRRLRWEEAADLRR
jgi:hypothetical protein